MEAHSAKARLAVLATAAVALACPAAAAASATLSEVGAEAGGNGVRVTAEVVGERVDDVAVSGNYEADVTSFSAFPSGSCQSFNTEAIQPVLTCGFQPHGLAPGTRLIIDLTGDAPCPTDGQVLVEAQNRSTGSQTDVVVPCVQGQGADLGVTLSRRDEVFSRRGEARIEPLDSPGPGQPDNRRSVRGVAVVQVLAIVTNHGPDVARDAFISVLVPSVPGGTYALLSDPKQPAVVCARTACELGDVPSGASRLIRLRMELPRPARVAVPLLALSSSHDPGPNPHQVSYVKDVDVLPDSAVRRVDRWSVRGRTTTRARAVRVAIVRTAGGANLADPGRLATGSAATCYWLRSVELRFKRQRGRQCSRPVWLNAKRNGRDWRLRFERRLPPGRYTVISSASAGVATESSFSKRDGNRRTFTVKRRT